MFFRQHPEATCRLCNEGLWYGVKEEPTGWKVFYACKDGCHREWMVGLVSRGEIEHVDEVFERAKEWAP